MDSRIFRIAVTFRRLYSVLLGFSKDVRCGSHWSESSWSGLRNEQTCGMTLASAYVLHHLSAAWSQLQMMGRSLRWK